jgi:hypothetical protein
LEQRLALNRTARHIALFTVLLELAEMASEGPPSLDLDLVQRREATTEEIATIPFKPSACIWIGILVGEKWI